MRERERERGREVHLSLHVSMPDIVVAMACIGACKIIKKRGARALRAHRNSSTSTGAAAASAAAAAHGEARSARALEISRAVTDNPDYFCDGR